MVMGPSLLQRLVVGRWRLVIGGGRRLVVGDWWLVVGGWWGLAVGGCWRLAVGGPWGLSLTAVLSQQKILLPSARHLEEGRGTTIFELLRRENCISRLCPRPRGTPPPNTQIV